MGHESRTIRHEGVDDLDGFVVSDEPIVSMDEDSLNRLLDQTIGAKPAPKSHRLSLRQPATDHRRAIVGVRHFLPEAVGSGYWDFFRLNERLIVSVTDAVYHADHWVHVEGSHHFKIRLLLSGRLLDAQGDTLIRGPQGHLHIAVGRSTGGYFIAKEQETRMVVLHCRSDLLGGMLGIDRDDTPPPFDRLFDQRGEPASYALTLHPDLARATQQIIDSRHDLPRKLRAPYIEAVAMGVLCSLLGEFTNRDLVRRSASKLGARDLNRIYEARDYLIEHYVAPPKIPSLARLVGVNQTKLKAAFKEAFGVTIYDFILQLRMERASQLLLANDCSVSEIAYQVGYEYPANFTCAFKKYYGNLPSNWRRP